MSQGYNLWNKQLPAVLKPAAVSNLKPIGFPGGPLGLGMMLLPAWYGKDDKGGYGPGRAVLDTIFGKDKIPQDILDSKKKLDEFINNYKSKKLKKKMEPIPELNKDVGNNLEEIQLPDLPDIPVEPNNRIIPDVLRQQPGVEIENIKLTPEQQQAGMQAINDYIAQLKGIQQPYVDALQNYIDNYDKYLNNYHRARDFYTGLAGWSGNSQWADLGKDYNTLANEANRVNAIKQLQDAQAGNLNAINEVMGNMAIANELDLPYETAFANKNLLSAMTSNRKRLTDWEKAQLLADTRRYGYDVGYRRALDQQDLRNKGALDVANVNAQAYGYGGGVAPGLNQQGTVQQLNNLYR